MQLAIGNGLILNVQILPTTQLPTLILTTDYLRNDFIFTTLSTRKLVDVCL
jgi:hypothetical protein